MVNLLADRCLNAAKATGAFTPEELDVLEDVLIEWSLHPGKDYVLLTEWNGGSLAGFLIYGPTPMTRFAFDLYWVAVDPAHQKKGIGRILEKRCARPCSSNPPARSCEWKPPGGTTTSGSAISTWQRATGNADAFQTFIRRVTILSSTAKESESNGIQAEGNGEETRPPSLRTKKPREGALPALPLFPSNRPYLEALRESAGEELWNDWRWQMKARITTAGELARSFPFPRGIGHAEEKP